MIPSKRKENGPENAEKAAGSPLGPAAFVLLLKRYLHRRAVAENEGEPSVRVNQNLGQVVLRVALLEEQISGVFFVAEHLPQGVDGEFRALSEELFLDGQHPHAAQVVGENLLDHSGLLGDDRECAALQLVAVDLAGRGLSLLEVVTDAPLAVFARGITLLLGEQYPYGGAQGKKKRATPVAIMPIRSDLQHFSGQPRGRVLYYS